MGRILLFDSVTRYFIIFEKGRSFSCLLLVDIVKQIGKFIVLYFLFAFEIGQQSSFPAGLLTEIIISPLGYSFIFAGTEVKTFFSAVVQHPAEMVLLLELLNLA